MLYVLSYLSFAFCLTAGGLLTADTVSSEKREGTLGLLFLTPLSAGDIVLGKMACHGLQLFYGLCAVAPAFFLPLLIGGVTGAEVTRVLLALMLTLLLAASVGVMVSVLGYESKRTLMAVVVSLALIVVLPLVMVQCLNTLGISRRGWEIFGLLSPAFTIEAALDATYRTAPGPKLYWSSMAVLAVVSSSLIGLAGGVLARVFRAMGHESAATPQRSCQSGRAAREVGGNPYEWLVLRGGERDQTLGWVGRMFVVVWVGLPTVFLLTKHYVPAFISAFFTALAIHVFYKLQFAIEASQQIQSDRQSGGLELLLVTELSEQSITRGHQDALRRLSRGPFRVMLGINLALELVMLVFPRALQMNAEAEWAFSAFFLGGIGLAAVDLAALRWLALWQGLQGGSHVRAVLMSLGLCLVVPWLVFGLVMGPALTGGATQELATVLLFGWVGGSLVYGGMLAGFCQARLAVGIRQLVSEAPERRSDWQAVWAAAARAIRSVVNPRFWLALGAEWVARLSRPHARRGLLTLATLAVVVFGFYAEENWRGWQAWQRYRLSDPRLGRPMDPASRRALTVPDAQNVFTAPRMHHWFLEPGENELTRALNPGGLQAMLGQYKSGLNSGRQPSAQEFLTWSDRCKPEFEMIRQALQRPLARVGSEARDLSGRPRLNQSALVILERILRLRIGYHLQLGHAAEARQELALLHELGRLLRTGADGEPESLGMGFALTTWAGFWSEAVGDGIRTRAWSADDLVNLQQQLRATDLFRAMASVVASERIYSCNALEAATRSRMPGVFGEGRTMTLSEKIFDPAVQILALGPRGWVYQNMVFVAREYPVAAGGVDFTNHLVWPGRAAQAAQEVALLDRDAFPYRRLGLVLLPDPNGLARRLAQAQTLLNQGQIACALERYRLDHGGYPPELTALAPRYMATVPADVIRGEPLKYRLDQHGYILYSIGWNERDDGGLTNTTAGVASNDWVWPAAPNSP